MKNKASQTLIGIQFYPSGRFNPLLVGKVEVGKSKNIASKGVGYGVSWDRIIEYTSSGKDDIFHNKLKVWVGAEPNRTILLVHKIRKL